MMGTKTLRVGISRPYRAQVWGFGNSAFNMEKFDMKHLVPRLIIPSLLAFGLVSSVAWADDVPIGNTTLTNSPPFEMIKEVPNIRILSSRDLEAITALGSIARRRFIDNFSNAIVNSSSHNTHSFAAFSSRPPVNLITRLDQNPSP